MSGRSPRALLPARRPHARTARAALIERCLLGSNFFSNDDGSCRPAR